MWTGRGTRSSTHFLAQGTEDYYGWAGGVNPTREDEFDASRSLANVRVGGVDGDHTRGSTS
ncbi:MAG: hypothetical protein U1G05_05845 [Kiritimatiellia bacterium]